MISIADLLAAAKAGTGIPSNYRLARVLGVTDNTVSNWANGRRLPDDSLALKLAQMGELDPEEVLVSIYAARAAQGPMGDLWRRIADRVHDSAHGALLAVLGTTVILSALFAASPDAAATTLTRPAALHNGPSVYYVNLIRWLRRLARLASPHGRPAARVSSVRCRTELTPRMSGPQPAFA